jgi:hypothetical protein
MKYKLLNLFISSILVMICFTVQAQSILDIIEKDRDKKYLDKNGNIKDAFINNNIVDINSHLLLRIKKDSLYSILKRTEGYELPESVHLTLKMLLGIAKEENKILAEVSKSLKSLDRNSPEKVRIFNTSMQRISSLMLDVLERDPESLYLYERINGQGLFKSFFMAINSRIDQMELELDQLNKESEASIQLGAWIYNNNQLRPIHINGFDALPQQEYYSVSRWQVLPTTEQIKELNELQQYSRNNKDMKADILKNMSAVVIDSLSAFTLNIVKNDFKDILTELNDVDAELQSSGISQDLKAINNDFDSFRNDLVVKLDYYRRLKTTSDFTLDNLFTQLNSDIQMIEFNRKSIKDKLTNILVKFNLLNETVKPKTAELKNLVSLKIQLLNKEFKNDFNGRLNDLLNSYKLSNLNLEFSDQVFKLSLTDLPNSAEIDLGFTGQRIDGDHLIIKMQLVTKEKRSELEVRDISLFRVAPHFQGTVGVIFAHPFQSTAIQNEFQMAPYYNLLIKGWGPIGGERYRRRSVINNTFAEFSWGIHLSSPDFNKDDVPELGVGVVLSFLKDYLQAGVAHNIFENKSYGFFGIRLPVPAMNFGGNGQAVQ